MTIFFGFGNIFLCKKKKKKKTSDTWQQFNDKLYAIFSQVDSNEILSKSSLYDSNDV